MLIQISEKQEELRARKKYKENIKHINSLNDASDMIDDLKRKMSDKYYKYVSEYMKDLSLIQDKMIAEMRFCEEENLDMCEKYEERKRCYESV